MTRSFRVQGHLFAAAALVAAACDAVGGVGANSEVVARAFDHELSVDGTADLLASQNQLPNQAEVAEALADLWIDYTLLAIAAQEDSTLAGLDLTPLVRQQMDQEVVLRLRDRVIQVDTVFSEEQLVQLYETAAPGAQVQARHILVSWSNGGEAGARDSVFAVVADLRDRVLAGEDFAALAREHSQDPGTASLGGDLGFFNRGDMVPAFDSVAFSLRPGEMGEPVRTPYGVHLIRVEDRRQPSFEDGRTEFEARVKADILAQAESAYLARVMGRANIDVPEGAFEVMRQLAARPNQRLTGRASGRALVDYDGGEFTAGEFQQFLHNQAPAFRAQLRGGSDDQLGVVLESLVRGELLVREAEQSEISLSEAEQDSLISEARSRFSIAARQLGLTSIALESGESVDEAIDRTVRGALRDMLQGEEDVIPLGTIAYTLRQAYRGEVYTHTLSRVVNRVDELRLIRGGSAPVQPPDTPAVAPNAPPPTGPGEP